MNTDPDTAYQRSLEEIWHLEPQNRILSKFWTYPAGWPQGNKALMFIGEAISTIGRAKFQDAWTNAEFGAQRSVSSFPTFEGTLLYHAKSGGEMTTRSQTTPASTSPEKFGKRLADENENLRPQYAAMAARWNTISKENGPLRHRLEWVVDWLAARGRDGQLETYLRRVDTAHHVSNYSPAPAGFWETESIFRNRLRDGHVKLLTSTAESAAHDFERYYIFLSRNSVAHARNDVAQVDFLTGESDIHYSIYMKLMRRAIEEYRITPTSQPKKSELVAYFKEQWPGDEPLSDNMAKAMASLVREPERQLGKAWKPLGGQ